MAENAGTIFYEVDAKTDKLIDSGKRAANSLDNLQTAFDRTDRAAANASASMDKTSTSMGKASRATAEEAAALSNLLGKIDPVVAATKRLDTMQDQLSAAFSKGQISASQYQTYLAKLEAQYAKLNTSADTAKKATNSFGTALTPLAGAIAGVISLQTIKQWGLMAEQFSLFQARITRLSPSIDVAAASYQTLLKISESTGSTMTNTVKLWESLTSTLKALGATNAQVLTLTSTLQKIGTIGGSSAEETANALRQLSQSLAGGTLRAEEFNSVVENTPELARQIAKGFGVSMGQLRQMMLDGQITAEKLFDVLMGRTQEVNAEFEKLPRTITQAANALTTQFGAALSVIDKATGASQLLAKALDAVAVGVQRSLNPTDQERLNELLRERADLYDAFAKRVGKWNENGMTAQNQAEQLKEIEKEILAIQDRRVAQQKAENAEANKAAAPKAAASTTVEGQKAIQQLAEQNALARAQGEEKAKLTALQKLGLGATQQERDLAQALAVDTYRLTEAEKTRVKEKKAGISEAAKAQRAEEAAQKKAATALQTANDADQKKFAELGQAIANVGQSAREVAQDTAQMSLSKFATPDEIQRVRDMAGALYDLKGAKSALAQADPIANQNQQFAEQMKQLDMLHQAKGAYALDDARYEELAHAAKVANAAQLKVLQEENFKSQALGNQLLLDSIDALAAGATQSISGLLSGTASLQDALGGIANTVLNTVVGAFVQMGADWVKQQIMMAAAAQATTVAQTTGIGTVAAVQEGATTAIAATTTSTAATTGTAVASSMAPAAGLSSIASFGSAAVIGGAALLATMLIAKSFGGGRRAGGAVNPRSVYRVNEGGAPEIFNAGGQQYMIPNQRGQVVSNKNATADQGGAGAGTEVNIHNYTSANATVTRSQGQNGKEVIDVVLQDIATGGPISRSINQITGTKRAGT
jgi:tape measure domain-containing protein